MKCVLHIGSEKTGSTTLQHWLYDNRTELETRGVCLSDSLGIPSNRLLALYFQTRIDAWCKEHGLEDRAERRTALAPALQSLRDEVQRAETRCRAFLITSEHLHSRLDRQDLIEELCQLLKTVFASIHVVGFVRNQADLVRSAYSSALRINETRSFSDFVASVDPEQHELNHFCSATLWSRVFGRSNVSFRVYEHCVEEPGGVVADFVAQVLNVTDLPAGGEKLNTALGPFHAAAFRQINALYPRWPAGSRSYKMNRHLKRLIAEVPTKNTFALTDVEAQQILGRFEGENERFFEEFGDGTNHFSPERWLARRAEGVTAFKEDPDLDAVIKALLQQMSSGPDEPEPSPWQRLKFWR